MTTHSPAPSPTVHVPESPAVQTIVLAADPEPLLLPRVLQKFAVPNIELLAVTYDAHWAHLPATIEIRFRTSPARARLTAAKLRKLVLVREVTLKR